MNKKAIFMAIIILVLSIGVFFIVFNTFDNENLNKIGWYRRAIISLMFSITVVVTFCLRKNIVSLIAFLTIYSVIIYFMTKHSHMVNIAIFLLFGGTIAFLGDFFDHSIGGMFFRNSSSLFLDYNNPKNSFAPFTAFIYLIVFVLLSWSFAKNDPECMLKIIFYGLVVFGVFTIFLTIIEEFYRIDVDGET